MQVSKYRYKIEVYNVHNINIMLHARQNSDAESKRMGVYRNRGI